MPVVAGVDISPLSKKVVRRAAAMARALDTDLHLVHVFHTPVALMAGPGVVALDLTAIENAERTEVWAAIADELEGLDRVQQFELAGYPPDVLVDHAKSVGADLLVVGTRGRGELASLILGSTSHRAIHLAVCDVLVVKPDLDEE